MSISDRDAVLEQYRDATNLDARVQLHERYSTNRYGWHPWVFDQLDLTAGQSVLEIGCGPGHLWRTNLARLAQKMDVTLTDLSAGMLAEARRNIGVRRRFRYVAADVQELPFGDARFAVVIANHMLYHVPDRQKALAEIRRVLQPEGRLYASTNGRTNLSELGDMVSRFAPDWVTWSVTAGEPDAFTLENGAAQLARQFPRVELRRYEDALVVTKAGPLLAYVLSGSARLALDDERTRALAAFIDREIATHGEIRIAKDSGLFVAW